MKKRILLATIAMVAAMMTACSSMPEKAQPVTNFKVDKYLGKWYEIARIDFKHEKDMDNTTAQYSLNEDGSVKVLNSGYNFKKEEWTSADGKAKFRESKDIGALKVSFFGPFYSGYNVIALDENYKYALVAGKDLDYLWILSREKTIPENIKTNFLKKAQEIGFDTNRLIWVKHHREGNPFLNEK